MKIRKNGGLRMENQDDAFVKAFYQALEGGIGDLPQAAREALYRPCAVGCVNNYVLKEQQRQFDECGGDLDLQYEKYGRTPYFFADILERGRVYEIGYPGPACVCQMVAAGLAGSAVHCECSRQSMLYVLETLLPEKRIRVELLHAVLTGAHECRFRVTIEER